MEPAPYRTGLIRQLLQLWDEDIEVFFVAQNMTQAWPPLEPDPRIHFLPAGTWRALRNLLPRLNASRTALIHVAGWGHPLLLCVILLAAVRRIPVVAESDTQQKSGEPFWRRHLKRILYPKFFSLFSRFLPAGT